MIETDPTWHQFGCEIRPERDAVRVLPQGELDLASADVVRTHIAELLDAGFQRIVLDLRGIVFLDSTGLRLILESRSAAREAGAELTVAPGPPAVQRVFELTCTAELIFEDHRG